MGVGGAEVLAHHPLSGGNTHGILRLTPVLQTLRILTLNSKVWGCAFHHPRPWKPRVHVSETAPRCNVQGSPPPVTPLRHPPQCSELAHEDAEARGTGHPGAHSDRGPGAPVLYPLPTQ